MEPADHHRDIGSTKLAREIERARKLVGLHADQSDETAAGGADRPDDPLDVDNRVALVAGVDLDIDVGPERLGRGAFGEQSVDAGEAVGRDASSGTIE